MAFCRDSTRAYTLDPVTLVVKARQDKLRYKTLFVEGVSDVKFWETLTAQKGGIKLQYTKGKQTLIEALDFYNESPDTKGRISFCMDRDFDQHLPLTKHTESHTFYQMSDKHFQSGFNDLECFLINSECFENVLTNYFGISNTTKIREIRSNVIEIAAIIGSYRLANRKFQQQQQSDKPFLYCFRTYRDFDGNTEKKRSEICVDFFLDNYIIKEKNGLLTLDTSIADAAIKMKIVQAECAMVVPEILQEAAQIRSQYQGNEISYCRGHDLTELLFFLLSQRNPDRTMDNSSRLEEMLRNLPHDPTQKASYLQKLQALEVNQFVKI